MGPPCYPSCTTSTSMCSSRSLSAQVTPGPPPNHAVLSIPVLLLDSVSLLLCPAWTSAGGTSLSCEKSHLVPVMEQRTGTHPCCNLGCFVGGLCVANRGPGCTGAWMCQDAFPLLALPLPFWLHFSLHLFIFASSTQSPSKSQDLPFLSFPSPLFYIYLLSPIISCLCFFF